MIVVFIDDKEKQLLCLQSKLSGNFVRGFQSEVSASRERLIENGMLSSAFAFPSLNFPLLVHVLLLA